MRNAIADVQQIPNTSDVQMQAVDLINPETFHCEEEINCSQKTEKDEIPAYQACLTSDMIGSLGQKARPPCHLERHEGADLALQYYLQFICNTLQLFAIRVLYIEAATLSYAKT